MHEQSTTTTRLPIADLSGRALNLWHLGRGYQLRHGHPPPYRDVVALADRTQLVTDRLLTELRRAGLYDVPVFVERDA